MQAGVYLAVVVTLSAPALKEHPKVDPRLVGTWVLERAHYDGKDVSESNGRLRYSFTREGRWVARPAGANQINGSVFAPESGRDPASIDLTKDPPNADAKPIRKILPEHAFPPRRIMRGIYLADGESLTLCLALGDGERPTSLRPDQKGVMLLVFSRFKSED